MLQPDDPTPPSTLDQARRAALYEVIAWKTRWNAAIDQLMAIKADTTALEEARAHQLRMVQRNYAPRFNNLLHALSDLMATEERAGVWYMKPLDPARDYFAEARQQFGVDDVVLPEPPAA